MYDFDSPVQDITREDFTALWMEYISDENWKKLFWRKCKNAKQLQKREKPILILIFQTRQLVTIPFDGQQQRKRVKHE